MRHAQFGRRGARRHVSVIIMMLMTIGYICGFLMIYSEILFWMPTTWSIMFLI